ncbi:hypothetical protein Tco_0838061 [Tanacetum coccineum]
MGDTIAQTRFENVSKHSNDSLIARGNTLRSDEDRLKLDELMALCTTLQNRVLDLENTKTSQHNEIASLKRRVKKLEKKDRSRTHRLKRLYKVGLTARLDSYDDEESLGEDDSKQGNIDAIDADKEITLVSVHDMSVFAGEEVAEELVLLVLQQLLAATTVSAATTTTATINTIDDVTLAQALKEMKSTKPKKKGIVIQELGESTTTISSQLSSQQSQDKGKGILIEPVKPMKKKDQIRLDEETALNLQAKFNEEERLAGEMQAQEQEELSIEEKATLFQQLLEKRRKHFVAKRAEEKRNKPPPTAQQRKIICTYLKNMEGYKLKDLKLKEFDSIQEMFDRAFKRQKVKDDKEIAELKHLMEIILGEEEVAIDAIPLAVKSPRIVDWMIYKEGRKSYYQIIRADGKSQMYMFFSQMLKSFYREDLEDLYKLVKANYKLTRLVEDLDVILWGDLKTMFEPHVEDKVWRNQQFTAALIDVNTAQSKLVLLENFNENYSKCLRLMVWIRQKSHENRQKRANTDTRNGRAQKKPGNQAKVKVNTKRQSLKSSNPIPQVSKVTQMVLEGPFLPKIKVMAFNKPKKGTSFAINPKFKSLLPLRTRWAIQWLKYTMAGVEAQRMMGFVLKALTEVAQMSQSRIVTLAIRMRSFGDLTDENHHPIIGRIQGMI